MKLIYTTDSFPLVAAPAAVASGSDDPTPADNLPLRVLLVEDHADTNEALTMLLQLRGYSVVSALDVRSGVELAAKHVIDVLISDLGLPDGDAGEVMREVAYRYSAVGIALSGYGMEDDFRKSKAFGFSHHLVKPVEIVRLEGMLNDIANRTSGETPICG